jgi:cell division protein FtsA
MFESNNNNTPLVVALDIGTTKVCAIAGFRNDYDKIEIVGYGTVPSEGVSRGVVSNIDKTVKAIKECVEVAERNARMKFSDVYVGIAGQHIKSLHHHGLLVRQDSTTEIQETDVNKLIKDMHKLVLPPGDKILHVIPQEFTVDDESNIIDPVGMSGVRLEANFHIITGQVNASKNIYRCVEKAGLKVANMTLEPIASASAVLSDEEKEAGVALVDIGGGTTDITIFKDGIIRHTAVIPFGGNVITADIQEGCMVMKDQAEKLKVKFGAAVADEIVDNRVIIIPGFRGRDPKEISEKNLSRIIQARVEEIFEYVQWEVRRSGYDNQLLAGLVLTGGGSLLKDIDLLAQLKTGLTTRLGEPVEHLAHGYNENIASPIYSTGVGLLNYAINNMESELALNKGKQGDPAELAHVDAEDTEDTTDGLGENGHKRPKWLDKIFVYTKEFFETTPDSEF